MIASVTCSNIIGFSPGLHTSAAFPRTRGLTAADAEELLRSRLMICLGAACFFAISGAIGFDGADWPCAMSAGVITALTLRRATAGRLLFAAAQYAAGRY